MPSDWAKKEKRRINRVAKSIDVMHELARTDMRVKALLVIEALTMGEMTWKSVESLESTIYKYAHVGNGSTCLHPDWEAELEQDYKKLKERNII